MLKSNYQLSFSSQTNHRYQEWIAQVQEKVFLAVSIELLKRLVRDSENIVSERLKSILKDKDVWNKIQTLSGFKKNERELSDPLIDSSRKLLLFRKLILCLSITSAPFNESKLVRKILDKIPESSTSIVLEELLDDFMKKEQHKLSPNDENPFLREIKRARTIDEYFADISETEDDEDYFPDKVDKEIQSIQFEKQKKTFTVSSNNQRSSEEGSITVDSELRGYIHSVLCNLHSQNNLGDFVQDYIAQLENHADMMLYINRPAYKLALRIRNILIFSYSNENQSFSKEGISRTLSKFKETLNRNLEINLSFNYIQDLQDLTTQQEYFQKTIYKIACKIQNKIIGGTNPELENLSKDFDPNSREDLEFLSRNVQLLDDYREICLEELHVSVSNLSNHCCQVLKNTSNLATLRNDLNQIFIDVAKQIASVKQIEFAEANFEKRIFGNNSSNALLEFSRHLLASVDFTFEQFSREVDDIFNEEGFADEICLCLHEDLKMDYLWDVYFPVTGISVGSKSHEDFFHELAYSLSETHEIKFLSPEILKSVSIEATSSIEGGPIVFAFKNASACASFKRIRAGDSKQALKIAITQLVDSMELQWYLTKHGHQYKVEPLTENSQITAFCKQQFNNVSSSPNWWINSLSFKRAGTCNYDLSEKTRKYLAIPAHLIKILTHRAESADLLSKLARNILHGIKLFRQGYFSENLSERFRLYWTITETLFSTEVSSSKTVKHFVPYRVSLFQLGVTNLLKSGEKYEYRQVRIWMREDIEDLYTFVRNPLIHDGVEHTPAYERLMDRFEYIVSSILKTLAIIVTYKTLPDDLLEEGMEGIIQFMETQQPSLALIQTEQ